MRTPEGHEPETTEKESTGDIIRNQDYVERITAQMTGVDKKVVKNVVDTFWDTICNELEHGHIVKLHGKGRFYLSHRSRRVGRNPATGESHIVPEREAMAFQTSPAYAKKLRKRRSELRLKPKKNGKADSAAKSRVQEAQ